MESTVSNSKTRLLSPPAIPEKNRAHNWRSLPCPDAVTDYIAAVFLEREDAPDQWQVARLSPRVYIYREKGSGWKVVAKFYNQNTRKNALHAAEREYRLTRKAWKYLGTDREYRAVQPLGLWRGIVFFEFAEGLTLKDEIAIRRNRPGKLFRRIEMAAIFLSELHEAGARPESSPDFGQAADYAYKLVDNLTKQGVLQNHPGVQNRLGRLIEKWATDPLMWKYKTVCNHGSRAAADLVFPPAGGLVAVNWERSEPADPAADLGRLMADVTHSVNQHGGDFAEGTVFANHLLDIYCGRLDSRWDTENLAIRTRFYQAACALRIASDNGLSYQDRLDLVLQAFALFSNTSTPRKNV